MLETIFAVFISQAALLTILIILFKFWIGSRIKASIEHEYKKQFKLFELELEKKEKVELVAELLAEYMRTPLNESMTREQRTLLNKLSFKTTLWLPPDLSIELAKRLQNKDDAKTPFDLVLMARTILTGNSSLKPEHVTYWDWTKENKDVKKT